MADFIRAFIGLGSNLDNPIRHVRQACEDLAALPRSIQIAVSRLYRSRPLGPVKQPDYINAVAAIDTQLAPLELLNRLQDIELAHGRIRTGERWGPRTLDLDLLLYGEQVIDITHLQVPHPGLYERNFVLYPLQEVAPAVNIPGHGSIQTLIRDCSAEGLEPIVEV